MCDGRSVPGLVPGTMTQRYRSHCAGTVVAFSAVIQVFQVWRARRLGHAVLLRLPCCLAVSQKHLGRFRRTARQVPRSFHKFTTDHECYFQSYGTDAYRPVDPGAF
jgi:hypothetical protein